MRTSVTVAIGSMSTVALLAVVAGVAYFGDRDKGKRAPRAEDGPAERALRSDPLVTRLTPAILAGNAEANQTPQASAPLAPQAPPAEQKNSLEQITELFDEVAKERLDSRWAQAKEVAIREATKDIPGFEATTVHCASIRCTAEFKATSSKAMNAATKKLTYVPGLAKTLMRLVPNQEGGFSMQAVLAKDGFDVFGKQDANQGQEPPP